MKDELSLGLSWTRMLVGGLGYVHPEYVCGLGKQACQYKKGASITYLLDIFPVWAQQNSTLNFKDKWLALASYQGESKELHKLRIS